MMPCKNFEWRIFSWILCRYLWLSKWQSYAWHISVSEDSSSSEHSSDSDDVNIRWTKGQKKTFVIDSDMEGVEWNS